MLSFRRHGPTISRLTSQWKQCNAGSLRGLEVIASQRIIDLYYGLHHGGTTTIIYIKANRKAQESSVMQTRNTPDRGPCGVVEHATLQCGAWQLTPQSYTLIGWRETLGPFVSTYYASTLMLEYLHHAGAGEKLNSRCRHKVLGPTTTEHKSIPYIKKTHHSFVYCKSSGIG